MPNSSASFVKIRFYNSKYSIGRTGRVHAYTGQFTRCRDAMLHPMVIQNIDRIDDIYLDNTMANLHNQGNLEQRASEEIEQIIE